MSPDALTARTLSGYLWRSRDRLWRGLALALLRTLAVTPCPWLFQRMIDRAVPAHDGREILQLTGIFLFLLGIHYVFSVWGSNEIAKAMAQMMVELRSRLFFKLQFLSFGYLDQQKTGRLLSKYAFDTQKVEALLYNVLNQFLPNVLYGAGIFVILAILNWRLALVLALVLPTYGFAKYRFFARIQRTNNEARLAHERLTGTANEYISALRLVRSFGEEKQAEAGLDRRAAWVTNVVKVRPTAGEGPRARNRPPRVNEVKAWLPILDAEIAAIDPAALLGLGAFAGRALVGPDFQLGRDRGRWLTGRQGRPCLITYHPAFILRQHGEALAEVRRLAAADFAAVRSKLGGVNPPARYQA